ncbi:MAG TPA: NAD(P)-dependent oxidoreductase [Roseimicrobium sp.]|nr:NAD(P)-dependent oxidoreductase [Roseimicrobium sp.]
MRVLVADKFEASGLAGLKKLGVDVDYQPDLKDASLTEAITASKAEVLVVRSTKVTAEMVEAPELSVIIRAGAGYNTIDVSAASDRGIQVTNCPGKNSQAVAELAFGLILACDRRIPDNVQQLREGKWNKKEFSKAKGLYGRTLGLVGMGKISQEMIARAKAFGMNVFAYSRWMDPVAAAGLGITRAESLEDIARVSDVVSVHVSLTKETRDMLGASFFDAMKPGSIFVNTSRAEVVDQEAMLAAAESKGIRLGLDVFDGEPTGGEGDYDGPLKSSSAYCTHHVGASTDQAQEAVASEVVRIVREYLLTGKAPNAVNIGHGEVATHLLVVRHVDKVGVLAAVLDVLKTEGVSVQEMENIVLGGAKAAIAQLSLDKGLSEASIARVKENADVYDANQLAINR